MYYYYYYYYYYYNKVNCNRCFNFLDLSTAFRLEISAEN
jgi:hypothetical protein